MDPDQEKKLLHKQLHEVAKKKGICTSI